ncbi:hypothetical protein DFH29DRAFT_920693, partial [Suillus ampliporus]
IEAISIHLFVIFTRFYLQYTLPASLHLIEHLHVVEILPDAEDERQWLLSELRIISALQFLSKHVIAGTPHKESNNPHDWSPCSRPSFTLVHFLRLLSTHHILRETALATFVLTRVASPLDRRKRVANIFAKYVAAFSSLASPLISLKNMYEGTSGIAAFVRLWWVFFVCAFLKQRFSAPISCSSRLRTSPLNTSQECCYSAFKRRWSAMIHSEYPTALHP